MQSLGTQELLPGQQDRKLAASATVGGGVTGSDGGFLLPSLSGVSSSFSVHRSRGPGL